MGLRLSLLERLEQAARLDDVLDKRRECSCLPALALGNVGDHAGVEVYLYLVACVDAVRRCLALEDRQTDVDGIAVEDTRERGRDNAGNAVLAENERCVLTGGAAAEVAGRNNDVARVAYS